MEKRDWAALKKALYTGLILLAAVVGVKYLLPLLLPFLIAFLAAWLVEPAIARLREKTRLPRGVLAGALIVLLFAVLGFLGYLLFSRLFSEAVGLIKRIPGLLESQRGMSDGIRQFLSALVASAHPDVKEILIAGIEKMFAAGESFFSVFYEKAGLWMADMAEALPGFLFSAFTAVIATFFLCADYPRVVKSIRGRLPPKLREGARRLKRRVAETFLKWLKAELILSGIAFFELFIGFTLLRIPFSLLLALGIAVVDILPVFGTGTVMIPWVVVEFFFGVRARAIQLLILYGVVTIVRTLLEPRVVGRQMGLSPLLALFSMYIGFVLLGVWGLIFAPVLAMLLRQFLAWNEGGESGGEDTTPFPPE
ncbi:sporulation integral membrane protein YtvI [Oscillospiraceae bacterium OttesenSCG-928-G22]|nr:sporulation integral membrane protein YtvI [Oscillospiraceae bacterium OttesenSCG-928-G22]